MLEHPLIAIDPMLGLSQLKTIFVYKKAKIDIIPATLYSTSVLKLAATPTL